MNGSLRDTLQSPRLIGLFDYWQQRCDGDHLPGRRHIDPLDMAEWLGNLLLMEVTADGSYRYRLYGSGFVQEFGREMTGRTIADLPTEQQGLIRAEYEQARVSRQPSARVYSAEFDIASLIRLGREIRKQASWERLVLPLANDGTHVDMLLVGAYQLGREPRTPPPAPVRWG